MIAACPSCGARYRIDTAKLRPDGARLRCSRCENIFRVRAPEPTAVEPVRVVPAPKPLQTPVSPPTPAPPAGRPRETAVPTQAPAAHEPGELVLVAHPEPEAARRIADALTSWGLEALVVHDGVEAILNIQRSLPRVVVLDAALPKMFGFQVCELMKRNESLRVIDVVLVGAIHDDARYRRPPGDLYGADSYVEGQRLPDALVPVLEGFGLRLRVREPAARIPAPPAPVGSGYARGPEDRRASLAPQPLSAPTPVPIPRQPSPTRAEETAPAPAAEPTPALAVEPAPVDPALAAETAQAERLARIIVSDVVLYNPEKFEAGVRDGNVVRVLEAELEEGRSLFSQRVDPRVGNPTEFLQRELLRVARSRGMK